VLDALLNPLQLPLRAVAEIEAITRALRSLSDIAERRLRSIDDHAGTLVSSVEALHASLKAVEGKVDALANLESTIEERMDGLREDLNTRMLALEKQVHALQPPIRDMARDVATIKQLLPEPGDGPMARLKDTLSKS